MSLPPDWLPARSRAGRSPVVVCIARAGATRPAAFRHYSRCVGTPSTNPTGVCARPAGDPVRQGYGTACLPPAPHAPQVAPPQPVATATTPAVPVARPAAPPAVHTTTATVVHSAPTLPFTGYDLHTSLEGGVALVVIGAVVAALGRIGRQRG